MSSSLKRKRTPSPTEIQTLFLPKTIFPLPDGPRLFVFNSHGLCPSKDGTAHKIPIISNIPVNIITTATLGCPHLRTLLSQSTGELAPHICISFRDTLQELPNKQGTVSELALATVTEMANQNITQSNPELHRTGSSVEEMELFCNGPTMAEGVHCIYPKDDGLEYSMIDASSYFGLTVVGENERHFYPSSNPKFPVPLPSSTVHEINSLGQKVKQLKTTKAFDMSPRSKHTLNLGINAYNASLNLVRNSSSTSRVQPSYSLLSTLLDTGFRNGTIRQDDCIVIFACRKIKKRPGGSRKRMPIKKTGRSIKNKYKYKCSNKVKIKKYNPKNKKNKK